MTGEDIRLVAAATIGIAVSIVLIVRARLHPFIALLCGAFVVGLVAGMTTAATAQAVEKGAGDIFGGTGLVVALGLALGAMLELSDGAAALGRAALAWSGPAGAPWASLVIALLIGLPLFFETGLVLLLPIVATAAAELERGPNSDREKLQLMLSALAGLSVVHALVPPHPGPLLAVDALHANLARTILYGLVIAVPTGIVAGPLLSKLTTRGIVLGEPAAGPAQRALVAAPALWRALIVVLLPVVLIAAGQVGAVLPAGMTQRFAWMGAASNPVLALLVACLVALPLLFGSRIREREVQDTIWEKTMHPAAAILLSIAAGGALKQVLVNAGMASLLARLAAHGRISPILLAWLVAVCIRLATGSATIATITTAGILTGVTAGSGASPEWMALAIGTGSVFFSHVNDPGFWLVKSYLGTDTGETFRTWSVLETAVSVVGVALVFLGSHLF